MHRVVVVAMPSAIWLAIADLFPLFDCFYYHGGYLLVLILFLNQMYLHRDCLSVQVLLVLFLLIVFIC